MMASVNLSSMLEQGQSFHSRLNELLMKLQQSIADFQVSRDMQKNDFLSGGANPTGGAPQAPPQMGGMPPVMPPGQQWGGMPPQGQ